MAEKTNRNFNFETFAVGAIKAIDSIRARNSSGEDKTTESRINAFYRGIGLPATSGNTTDKKNVDNVFTKGLEFDQKVLDTRETSLTTQITDEEISEFLNFDKNSTKTITASISENGRTRGNLFPMVVNSAVKIFPQSKRIGGAFLSDNALRPKNQKGVTFQRPLIESIILIRLKLAGVTNVNQSASATSAFISTELEQLADDINTNFSTTSNSIAKLIKTNIIDAGKLKIKIGDDFVPTVLNIAQQNPERKESEVEGEVDKKQKEQEFKKLTRQAILSIFEFDDTFNSINQTRNLRDAFLASNGLFDILVGEGGDQDKNDEETKFKKEQLEMELKKVFKILDLSLGVFSGLSGVDIIAVIAALFAISLEDLVGLVNEDAQDRLKKLKNLEGFKPSTVSTAKAKLEQEVTLFMDNLETQVSEANHNNQVKNK